MIRSILACVAWGAFASWAGAASYSIPVDAGDGSTRVSGGVDTTSSTGLFSGKSGTSFWSAVMPFELPAFALNETIVDAHLEFTARRFGPQAGTPFGDLYGLDYRSTAALLATDFFEGSADPNAAKLQDSILTPALALSDTLIDTDAAADALLATYLGDQLTAGATGGDFVFLRLNMDGGQAGDPRIYILGSQERGDGGVLTIETTLPEPGTLGLLLVSAAVAIFPSRGTLCRSL